MVNPKLEADLYQVVLTASAIAGAREQYQITFNQFALAQSVTFGRFWVLFLALEKSTSQESAALRNTSHSDKNSKF